MIEFGSNTEVTQNLHLILQKKELNFKQDFDPKSVILELGKIINKHGENKDFFSKKLIRIGYNLISNVNEKPNFLVGVEKINELQNLLIYGNPYLVDGVCTMEKYDAEKYRSYAMSFENRKVKVKPHVFANEIKDWLNKFMDIDEKTKKVFQIADSGLSKEIQNYQSFQALEASKKIQMISAFNMELEEKCQILESNNEELTEEFCLLIDRMENTSIENVEFWEKKFHSFGEQYKETVDNFKDIAHEAQENLFHVEGKLVSSQLEMKNMQQRINSLSTALNSCCNEINDLKNNNSGSCIIL